MSVEVKRRAAPRKFPSAARVTIKSVTQSVDKKVAEVRSVVLDAKLFRFNDTGLVERSEARDSRGIVTSSN